MVLVRPMGSRKGEPSMPADIRDSAFRAWLRLVGMAEAFRDGRRSWPYRTVLLDDYHAEAVSNAIGYASA